MARDYILVDGVDVTSYRINWSCEDVWKEAIPVCTITFNPRILSAPGVTLSTSSAIQVYRTLNTENDDFVFDGEVTQFKPEATKVVCECKGRLVEAIKAAQTKSWDKDIDLELGIGSEIIKTLIIDSNLSCTPAQYDTATVGSVAFTGDAVENVITKFIQKEEDNYDRMNLIADQYDHILWYNNYDGLVYFQPKGYSVYPYTLNVGVEIAKQIVWKENKEQLINEVIVAGATVFDTLVETFAGPASSFTLQKTPQDTEVRVGGSAGTLQVRGQKGVGVLGTNYDYEIDEEQKTLNFAGNESNVYIRYTAQVPCPVVLKNLTSIATYGGPLQTPSIKKVAYSDIKNLADAEARGRALLDQYSTPFLEAQSVKVMEAQTKLQVLKPGDLVHVIDQFTNKDVHVFIRSVRKTYPAPFDEIDFGDKIWRTENWQADQMKKINQIFNELQKNQDIVTQIFDFTNSVSFEPKYFAAYRESRAGYTPGSQFIFGSATLGLLGTNGLGSDTLVSNLEVMIPGNLEFKEYFYSTEFVDTDNTTSTIDTTNMRVEQ